MKNIILVFFLAIISIASYADDSIVDYLKKNRIDFNSATDLIPDSVIQNHQFFFVGEVHGYKANYEIAFKLLEELKRKVDIKYIIVEADWADGKFLNQAIQNEDTVTIKKNLAKYEGAPCWTREQYDFYKNLINLNKKYNNKIQIVGFDIDEGGFYNSIKRINELKRKYYEPEDSVLNEMKNFYYLDESCNDYLRSLIHKVDDKEYSVKDKQEYCLLLYNILDGNIAQNALSNRNEDEIRDSCMIENYKRIDKILEIGDKKMFGEWGYDHVYQKDVRGIHWFCSGLQNDLNKSIYSYEIYYIHGSSNIPTDWIPGSFRLFRPKGKMYIHTRWQNSTSILARLNYFGIGVGALKSATKRHSIGLYNLEGMVSPFDKDLFLLSRYETNGVTTDFFQSIIAVRNGKPCTSLGKNGKRKKN